MSNTYHTGFTGRIVETDVIGWRAVRSLVRGSVIQDIRQSSLPGGFVISAEKDGTEFHLEILRGTDGISFFYQDERGS